VIIDLEAAKAARKDWQERQARRAHIAHLRVELHKWPRLRENPTALNLMQADHVQHLALNGPPKEPK